MPNKNESLDQLESCYKGSFTAPNVAVYSQLPAVPPVIFREKRITTDRNTISKGGISSCRKPTIFKKKLTRLDRINPMLPRSARDWYADWRKKHPVPKKTVDSKKPPPGFVFRKVANGMHEVVRVFVSDTSDRYLAFVRPKLVERLVRIGPKVRHNLRVPVNAKVNDLFYWKRHLWTGSTVMYYQNPDVNPLYSHYSYVNYVTLDWVSEFGVESPVPDPRGVVDLPDSLSSIQGDIDRLSILALRRHYSKLKNQKIDLATELSQGLQTVNMIGDFAKRLSLALIQLKKGQISKASKQLFPMNRKQLANDYLAVTYGVKPLLQDIVGAAEQLAEFLSKAAPVKSNGHAKAEVISVTDVIINDVNTGPTVCGQIVVTNEIRVKYGTSFFVGDELTRKASQLGFTNPVNVVWELIPFSLVADWVIPIGDFLQNVTALSGLEIKESYKTVFVKRTTTCALLGPHITLRDGGDAHDIQMPAINCAWKLEEHYCKREVIPLPGVPLPSFKNPVSPTHVANFTALFSQFIK